MIGHELRQRGGGRAIRGGVDVALRPALRTKMARNLLKFVNVDMRMPDKREVEARRRDFREIYADFDEGRAKEQAGRCSQCGVPFCQVHCPLHNNIPDWLMLTAEGRLEEAYEIAAATNNMPEICGRICPQDRLCEGNCVIAAGEAAPRCACSRPRARGSSARAPKQDRRRPGRAKRPRSDAAAAYNMGQSPFLGGGFGEIFGYSSNVELTFLAFAQSQA